MNRGTKTMSGHRYQALEDRIVDWIINDVSKPISSLSGMSACPFVKKHYLADTIYFWFNDDHTRPNRSLEEMASAMRGWQYTTTVVYYPQPVETELLLDVVEQFNTDFPDFYAFVSDPGDWEPVSDPHLVAPPCQLVSIHWAKDIEDARPNLWMAGYYRTWTEEQLGAIDYLTGRNTKTK